MSKLIIKDQLENDEENINFHFHTNLFEEHSHNYYEIMLITKGSATHCYNKAKLSTTVGDCWFIHPSTSHSLYPDYEKESTHLNIAISSHHLHNLCDIIDISFLPSLVHNDSSPIKIHLAQSDYEKVISLTHKFQATPFNNTTKRNGILNILASTLLHCFYLQHQVKYDEVDSFISKFIKNLSDIEFLELKPSEVFQKIPYSYSQFERLFKKNIGMTFLQYFNNRKIEYAKSLLTTTDLSIIEISNKITMYSLGHFYKIFKECTNLTPTQYRKKYKKVTKQRE